MSDSLAPLLRAVHDPRIHIRPMLPHAKVPLLAFAGLVHLRVTSPTPDSPIGGGLTP